MIITVTLNPAIDKTAEVDILRVGELNRIQNIVSDVGGKGINVSKMISAIGGESIATGFIGGTSGNYIAEQLSEMNIQTDFVYSSGVTRTNLKVLDNGTRLTEINEPGILVTREEENKLIEKITEYSSEGAIFVLSGSLCRGIEKDFYSKLTKKIRDKGGKVFLDADGESFSLAVKQSPDFVKPNKFELLEYLGIKEDLDVKQLSVLAKEFMANNNIRKMALSMGADGAIFLDESGEIYSPGLKIKAHSAVGAGDSMMGAFAYAESQNFSWIDTIKLAMASSAGSVTTIGTKAPSKEVVYELMSKVEINIL